MIANDFVKVNLNHKEYITPIMQEWLENHKDKIFRVEKIENNLCKLIGIRFLIDEKLLEVYTWL